MDNKLLSYINRNYKTLLGSFSPETMSVFINDSYYESEYENDSDIYKRNRRVYFHEIYHFWQMLFTPFGQLRWYQTLFSSDEIIEIWTKAATKDEKMRKIPIGNLAKNKDKVSLAVAMIIKMSSLNIMHLNLMLHDFWNDELERIASNAFEYLCPTIEVDNKKYRLEGIDIIETYDKYQEAIYANIIFDIPFEEIMNYDILKKQYYLPYVYYLSEIGNDIEFPTVCEIALMTNKIGSLEIEDDWKKYHPAWRFVKIIEILKSDTSIPHIEPTNIERTYEKFVNYVLEKCQFEDVNNIWKDIRISDNSPWKSALSNEKNAAADFKAKYPWILSYPFCNNGEAIKMIYKFEPHFLIYTDNHITIFERDKDVYGESESYSRKWKSETSVELHRLALSNQITGIKSEKYIYNDMIQCGCGYYDINICKYYGKECNGYLEKENEIYRDLKDEEKKRIASDIEKIKELRDNKLIQEYEREIHNNKMASIMFNGCQLDYILQVMYGFCMNDINVNMEEHIDIINLEKQLME